MDHGHSPVLGSTWTIDTPYRETVAEARHYQQEGILTVEMEAVVTCYVVNNKEREE